jgi:hypothetical protein
MELYFGPKEDQTYKWQTYNATAVNQRDTVLNEVAFKIEYIQMLCLKLTNWPNDIT